MASLQIPLALWRDTLDLNITRVLSVPENNWIFVGLASGLILHINVGLKEASLHVVMQGHVASIVGLDLVRQQGDQCETSTSLISLDSRGEVGLWSLDDGRCLLYNATGIPGRACGLLTSSNESLLYIFGHFNSILVLRISTLEVLKLILLSPTTWISCGVGLFCEESDDEEEEEEEEEKEEEEKEAEEEEDIGDENLQDEKDEDIDVLILFPVNKFAPIRVSIDLKTASCISLESLDVSHNDRLLLKVENSIAVGSKIYFSDLQRCWLLDNGTTELVWSCDDAIIEDLLISKQRPVLYLNDGSLVRLKSDRDFERTPLPKASHHFSTQRMLPWSYGGFLCMQRTQQTIELKSAGEDHFRTVQLLHNKGLTISMTAIYEHHGEERVIHGFTDGSIQIMSLFDGFMTFTAMIDTTTTLEQVHRASITYLAVHEDEELLVSGDRDGLVVFWSLCGNSVVSRFYHHSAAILSCIPLRSNCYDLWISVDQVGGVALINRHSPHLVSFIGTQKIPLKLVRLTSDSEDIRVALINVQNQVHLWNLTSGRRERECLSTSAGAEDLLKPFTRRHEIPHRRLTSAENLMCAFDQRHSLLGTSFSWRLIGDPVHEPAQIMVLDIRRLVTSIKQLTKTEGKTDTMKSFLRRALAFVMSLLLPWGVDEEVDKYAHNLGFSRPKKQIVAGTIGANGNFSFGAPSGDRSWSRSSYISASHFLALSSIFELPLVEVGDDWDSLRMAFSTRLLESGLGSGGVALPSFSYASKYWHDLNEDVRHASRLMIVQTLARMDESNIEKVIQYWKVLLPTSDSNGGGRKMNRAAIILGILAVHKPECLDEGLRKMLADSLMNLLMDDKRNLFRSAAIELIGKAYPVWQGHVQPLSLFRLLLSWLVNMSVIDDKDGVAQLVVPYDNAATIDTLEAVRGTLLKLVKVAPQETVPSWLGEDFSSSKSLLEKWISISLISDLVRAKPVVLRPYLIIVAEAICKLLEGGGHSLPVSASNASSGSGRGRLQLIAMPLLEDLVQAYSAVSLHYPSVRLAVAVPDTPKIHIFDLRSYTSPRICEGHAHPVTALDFSPDGRTLLSYSMMEATLRWWLLPSGLFGLFTGMLRPFQTTVVDPGLTEAARGHVERILEQPLGFPGVEMIQFAWKESTVSILVADEVAWEVPIPVDA